jgi:hypothetical protein
VKTELGEVALQYGHVVREALASAGGDQLARLADVEPGQRELAAGALGDTGAWDLDPRSGPEELHRLTRRLGRQGLTELFNGAQ